MNVWILELEVATFWWLVFLNYFLVYFVFGLCLQLRTSICCRSLQPHTYSSSHIQRWCHGKTKCLPHVCIPFFILFTSCIIPPLICQVSKVKLFFPLISKIVSPQLLELSSTFAVHVMCLSVHLLKLYEVHRLECGENNDGQPPSFYIGLVEKNIILKIYYGWGVFAAIPY